MAAQFGGAGLEEGMTTASQMGVQVTGILATAIWTGGLTYIILKVVGLVVSLRVSDEEETEGLDLVLHEEQGYNL